MYDCGCFNTAYNSVVNNILFIFIIIHCTQIAWVCDAAEH